MQGMDKVLRDMVRLELMNHGFLETGDFYTNSDIAVYINKKDLHNKRNLHLTESKIRRLTKYYHTKERLPEGWKYTPDQAKLMFE